MLFDEMFIFIFSLGKDFNGSTIKVELAQRQRSAFSRGGGRGGRGKLPI